MTDSQRNLDAIVRYINGLNNKLKKDGFVYEGDGYLGEKTSMSSVLFMTNVTKEVNYLATRIDTHE